MSLKSNEIKKDPFVHYNSLISLKLLSDHFHLKAKYLIRMENLEQNLLLKLCDSPLLEYSDLKESFFYIRDIDECQSIYGKNKSDDSLNFQYIQQHNNLKENGFSNMEKINFNQTFFLQHMMSKKFISIEKLQGNDNYSLKLVIDVESAMPFNFKRINETRSSSEPLVFNNIVYLSVYNKEKGQFYFINHASFDKINFEKIEEEDNSDNDNEQILGKEKKAKINKTIYSDLCLVNSAEDKFSIINQSWYINKKDYIYNGQLINIIFSKNKEKEKMMLSAQGTKVENKIEEIIGIKEEIREDIDGMLRENNQKYIEFYGTTDRIEEKKNSFSSIEIKGLKYEENLFEHVVNNSFWVIENEKFKRKEINEREPIKIGDLVRIKNPLLGLYLKMKKKDKDKDKEQKANDIIETNNNNIGLSAKNVAIFNNNLNNIVNNNLNNNNTINNNIEENEYEFELVNEDVLEKYYYNYNFQFFHYNANEENQNMVADGKYVLKSFFRELNENSDKNINKIKKFDFKEHESYFEPLFLTIKNENDPVSIKIEDDYILDIRKIDIHEGNEVIYLQNVISELDFILKSYKKKKTSSNSVIKKITQYINFFMEYLLNINYTFKDDNFEINHPIKKRQLLLDKYNILDTILEIVNYFLPAVKDIKIRDTIIVRTRSKKKTNIYNNNRVNDNRNIKESIQMTNENEKDSAISNMKSMLKLILKFLIYLSENNEDIKKKIFISISPILSFSEHIFSKDRSVLLDFIFDILKESESLQEYIVVGKLKLLKNNKNIIIQDKVLFIDKILTYIETTYNYLYYYKKLLHLKKIKYKTEEIKEKIKMHIKKVQKDFKQRKKIKEDNMNIKSKKELTNNYKEIIYSAIKNIKILAIDQIKDLNKYLDQKNDNDNNPIKRGKTNFFKKNENNEIKNPLKYKSEKKVNFAINEIKENSSSSNSIIKKPSKKIDLNDKKSEKINNDVSNFSKYEDSNYEAESNDYLNNRSPISQLKSKKTEILNKSPFKKSLFNESSKNNEIITKEQNINNDIDKNKSQENDISNLYSIKNIDDDFEAFATKKISDLKIILSFIKYFRAIKLNKLLFIKDQFFKDIFGKDIKEEFLENNLNFVINGDSTSINFINGIEYNSKSQLGPLFPLRLFNIFFPTLDDNKEIFDTKNIIDEKEEDESSEEDNGESDDDKNMIQKNLTNEKYNNKKNLYLDSDNENYEDNSENEKESNNNSSKEIDISNISEQEENIIPESPLAFKQKKNNHFNNSILKKSIKGKNKDENLKDDKNEDEKEDNTLRNSIKYPAVNALAKGIMFKSKIKKLLSNDKNNEKQKIYELCKEYDQKINKYLYILYSIYFFCINEFMEIVYKTYTILFNYSINYEYFSNIYSVKVTLNYIKENLLPRVIFINNNVIKNIYDKIKINSTLLNNTFSIENFNGNENKNDFANIIEHDNEDENNINLNNNEFKNKNKKTQFNRNSGNDLNNKDNKFFYNGNEFTKLKVLTNEEIILVDFLICYCKKNDQLNYLLEKIDFFKNLKKYISENDPDNEENQKFEEKKNESIINNTILKIFTKKKIKLNNSIKDENQIKNQFQIILEKLVKKRNDILILYEKLFDIKSHFLYSYKNSLSSNNPDDYGIEKISNFMIKFLKQYEIENYFNKIIYLEIKNNNSIIDKNSFEKLMNIQEVFKIIEGEIQKIKEEYEINNFKGDVSSMIDSSLSPRKMIDNKNSENHYQILNNKLQSITKKTLLNIFSMKELNKEGDIKLIEMLIKENENFFEKIGFINSLKIMVEFIKI